MYITYLLKYNSYINTHKYAYISIHMCVYIYNIDHLGAAPDQVWAST